MVDGWGRGMLGEGAAASSDGGGMANSWVQTSALHQRKPPFPAPLMFAEARAALAVFSHVTWS